MFPEDVAVAIGGPGTREYVVIEMHYNQVYYYYVFKFNSIAIIV